MKAKARNAALLIACLLVSAGLPALAQRPRQSASGAPGKRQKTVQDVSKELLHYIDRRDIPWQFYTHYSHYYHGLARSILATVTERTPKSKVEQVRKLAAQWTDVARTIENMAKYQRTIEEIRNNNTTVPYDDRKTVFEDARDKHRQLLRDLAAKLNALLTKRTPTPQPTR